jgi:hypothetical protein
VSELLKRVVFRIMLMLVVPGILTLASNPPIVQASPETTLYVDPPSIVDPTLIPGSTFTVDLMISDVEFLFSWQVNMSYSSAVLKCVNITEGEFLANQPEGTYGAKKIENEKGWALFGWSTLGPYQGVDGSGTLATIEYEILAEGESPLKIETEPIEVFPGQWVYPTLLIAQNSPTPPPNFYDIPFAAENGYFSNSGAADLCELIETIESWNLPKGTEKSLTAKMKAAIRIFEMGKEDGAIRKLAAFINRVEILRDKKLTNEQADYLTMEVQKFLDLIKG